VPRPHREPPVDFSTHPDGGRFLSPQARVVPGAPHRQDERSGVPRGPAGTAGAAAPNQLLTELDGFDGAVKGVIVLAATARGAPPPPHTPKPPLPGPHKKGSSEGVPFFAP